MTIDLYLETNGTSGLQVGSGGDTLVATTTTASNGTYSFAVATAGTYYVQESVPAGYIQTGGGPNGSAGNTYYTIVATSGHSYSGYNFDDFLIPTCAPTNVSYKVTTPSNCSTTVIEPGRQHAAGGHGYGHIHGAGGMNDTLTLVSYNAPGSSFSDSNAYQQVIYQQATGTFAPGTHSLTVKIPNTLLPDRLRLRSGDQPVGAEPERRCVWSGQRQHPLSCRGSLHLVGQRRHHGSRRSSQSHSAVAPDPDDDFHARPRR